MKTVERENEKTPFIAEDKTIGRGKERQKERESEGKR